MIAARQINFLGCTAVKPTGFGGKSTTFNAKAQFRPNANEHQVHICVPATGGQPSSSKGDVRLYRRG